MSRGDHTAVYATRMVEPPSRRSLETSYPAGITKDSTMGAAAAVGLPQNNQAHSGMASAEYNMARERASAGPSTSLIYRPDIALGHMPNLPQRNAAGAPRDAELPRRPVHAPHAWSDALEMPPNHAGSPPFSQGHRNNGSIGDGVHRSTYIERPLQPPSPTTIRLHNGEYRDRFNRPHAVVGPLPNPSAQQQPQQWPQAMTAHQNALLGSLSSQAPQRTVTEERPARTLEEDTRPARRTDVICRDFKKGLCRNNDCPRAHVLDLPPELLAMLPQGKQHTPNVQVPAAVHPSVRASNVELCKLNLVGKCPYGDSCKYSHDLGPVATRSPSPTPGAVAGPSRIPDSRASAVVPPATSHGLRQKSLTDDLNGAECPTSVNRNPNFIVYPDDVCRNHIQGRCFHGVRCKFRHWSPEEVQAFRAVNRAELAAPTAVDVVASVARMPHAPVSPMPPQETPSGTSPAHMIVATQEHVLVPGSGSGEEAGAGHDHPRPPDTARKRQKKRRAGSKSSETGEQAQSQDGKDIVQGKSDQPNSNSKGEKGKARTDSVQAKADVQTKREGAVKGKAKLKDGMNEKDKDEEVVPRKSTRKGKATTEDAPAPKETTKDVTRQAPREPSGQPTDPKGKGVARSAPHGVENSVKGHASQPAPTNPPPSAPKKSSAKKTGLAQSSAPAAPATPSRPPQPSSSSGQAAADDTETESDASDPYFDPVRDSGFVSAQTSLSSVEGSSTSTIPPKGLCWDHLEGRCRRRVCRYSHNVDRTLFSNAAGPTAPSLASVQGDSTFRRSSSIMQAISDVAGRADEPLVPPGLGLEGTVASRGDDELPGQSETVTITVHDSVKVTFSSGFGVVQVITGFESRQIILANVPSAVVPMDITAILQTTFGEVVAVLPGDSNADGSNAYRVTFAQADAAVEAAAALHGSSLFGVRVTARVAAKKPTGIGGGTLDDSDVLFELPTPRLTAYVGYETQEQADRAIALGNRKEIKGMLVSAAMYQGIPMVGMFNVRFEGLPPDFTVKDLERFGKFESHMWERPKYTSMHGAIQGLRHKLLLHDGRVTVNVLPPPYRKMFRLWAHFSDEQIAAVACENLHKFCPLFTGKQRIFAHHIKSLRYNLPPDFFDILAYDINLLRSYCTDDKGTSISVIDRRHGAGPTAPVLVKLLSRDMGALSKLKAAFDRLLRGEKVTENGHAVWDDFFGSAAGVEFLAEVERIHPKVRINRDPRRRTLALFGREPQRSRVREEIVARARLLKAQRQRRYPVAGDLIGVFMSEDLAKLQSELGDDNVWFDLTRKELVVRGDEDAQKVAGLAVQHARQRRQGRAPRADAACPVCFGDVSHPVTLSCGHRWCRACLTGYMHASVDTKTFPLKCLGDDAKCSHCIPLSTAQQLLNPDEFDAIVRASFVAYVQSRPDEFHYCPTPDCPQVYRKTKRNTVLQCPSCLIRICPHCDTEWHESGSCQDRDPQDEYLFDQWKGRHDVKDCPSCKVPIERMAGCNHMTCVSCKAHICWACLATFPTSQEVYDHMRAIHGGIGL